MKNAILISVTNDVISHHFCDAAFAQGMLEYAKKQGREDSAFFQEEDSKMDISDVYNLSPELRNRVAEAKEKLRNDLRIQAALDKHGVPKDPSLRASVVRAFRELRAS
jgi:hypothetical protein